MLFWHLPHFFGSLKPSARSNAELSRYDISGIPAGTLAIPDGPILGELFNGYKLKLLVYRSNSGQITAWRVPVKNGLVGMPDLHWFKPVHACQDLRVIGEGESRSIACLDQNVSDWWLNEWRWSLNGINLGSMVDDLDTAVGMVEGKLFVYAKRG